MNHFANDLGKYIDTIYFNLLDLKKLHDSDPHDEFFHNEHKTNAIERIKREIAESFNHIESLDAQKTLLENKANNLIHELEEEFKRLASKFQRLQSMERQIRSHFQILERAKHEIFDMFERKQLNQGVINSIKESLQFLNKEAQEDKKDVFDVRKELESSEHMIAQLRKYLNKEL